MISSSAIRNVSPVIGGNWAETSSLSKARQQSFRRCNRRHNPCSLGIIWSLDRLYLVNVVRDVERVFAHLHNHS